MPGGADEVETAVDSGVLDEAVTHGGQLLSEVGAVLVLDVFDDRVPAVSELGKVYIILSIRNIPIFVVDLVAIAWSINNVEAKTDTIFGNNF